MPCRIGEGEFISLAKHLALETVDFDNRAEVNAFLDRVMDEGMRRVRAEGAELRARGLMEPMADSWSLNYLPICAKVLNAISADNETGNVHCCRATRRGEEFRFPFGGFRRTGF